MQKNWDLVNIADTFFPTIHSSRALWRDILREFWFGFGFDWALGLNRLILKYPRIATVSFLEFKSSPKKNIPYNRNFKSAQVISNLTLKLGFALKLKKLSKGYAREIQIFFSKFLIVMAWNLTGKQYSRFGLNQL